MRVFQASLLNVARVRFRPDGATLSIIHRRSNRIAHFDLHSGDTRPNTRSDNGAISDIAYAADGRILAIAAMDGRVQVIDVGTDRTEANLTVEVDLSPPTHRPAAAVQFTPGIDPNLIWLGVAASNLCLWRPHTQEYIYHPQEGDYRGIAFSSDGSLVTSIESHGVSLTVWTIKPFQLVFRTVLSGLGDYANGSVAVLPDGDRIVYAAGNLLRCVSMSGGPGWETELKKPAIDLVLHPSGQSALIADGTKKVTQIDTTNGRPIQQFDWNIGKVSCVDISADGTLAAAGGEKGQVVVWDAE